MFFSIAEFERAAKVRKITVYCFLIPFQFQSYSDLNKSSITGKDGGESCHNQSKSIKFVMSCDGHVDVLKN